MTDQPARIVTATIRREPAWDNLGVPGGRMIAAGEFTDGEVAVLFSFYDDELTFREEELVGLTAQEARDLHRQRDVAYLRSDS